MKILFQVLDLQPRVDSHYRGHKIAVWNNLVGRKTKTRRVGPVDNGHSSDKLHYFVKKKKCFM